MNNAEATASSEPTGTGGADAAPADTQNALRLRSLLEPPVSANGLYLEDISLHVSGSSKVVHVVVDLPQEETGGVSLDQIAEISRVLGDVLDEDPVSASQPYDLEVSSPGVSRLLTEPRHWYRARGRMVRVNVMEGEKFTGRLTDVTDTSVTLTPEIPVKKGMKPKQGSPVTLPFGGIRNGKVEIEFSHLPEAGLENEHNGPSEEA
ncbi:ribosome maturation factor RimP [Pseudarthrobacter sp. PS3-L1]|uniref:ribosome maturation factor RimP n=1 Tax=Pseudarthrobacter sp. PS3-L1 TaxID=3046207 RepID=UPI0024B88FC3|nr:ribosome maturation factor RimP [Pseudarthrobacter sp. PS3-L1]MDJ0321864.1 ribosome maturation factor RimP [Pseudarthrobacter sp. PS3-L1]